MEEAKRDHMLLRVLTPGGVAAQTECDSVDLTMADDGTGHGGGSVGIRNHHADAVMALQKGPALARKDGKMIFSATLSEGFASVHNNVVTVIVSKAETK